MAVDGYDGALAAIASEDTVYWLMNPVGKDWRLVPGAEGLRWGAHHCSFG